MVDCYISAYESKTKDCKDSSRKLKSYYRGICNKPIESEDALMVLAVYGLEAEILVLHPKILVSLNTELFLKRNARIYWLSE